MYSHTITLIAPQALWHEANALALVIGDQPGDAGTFVQANAEDADGGTFAFCHHRIRDDTLPMLTGDVELIAPDFAPDADLAAAQDALNAIAGGAVGFWVDTPLEDSMAAFGVKPVSVEPDPLPVALPEIPVAVTARQARLVLLSIGLLDSVEGALAAIPGPEGRAALIEWEYATEIRRDSPLTAALSGQLGLTPESVDTLFLVAKDL